MEQYIELQNKLEAERETLRVQLETIAHYDAVTGDWVAVPVAQDLQTADENEEADAVEEWESRRALLVQLETRYRNILHALKKFETSTYGICEISGNQIERERLEANPASRTCITHREEESQLPRT